MTKKKLNVVEFDQEEKEIVLEENQSRYLAFLRKYRKVIFFILLLLSLSVLGISSYLLLNNVGRNEKPNISGVALDSSLTDLNSTITGGQVPITDETAKNMFLNNSLFKTSGETILVKTVNASSYIVKYYSDGTALKILKSTNLITRINPLENGEYGIDDQGNINSKAITSDVTAVKTEKFPWGTVTYYSDGSADITDAEINLFVRSSADIQEKYISNNKVSYLKETKNVGNIKLNYYHDGTIEVIKNNQSYLVRTSDDLNITSNNVTFKNNNEARIIKTTNLSDGKTIDYYEDGGAIIRDGSKTLSVRKSNSIVIEQNQIKEIVDSIYVTVSKKDGNNIYYTNASAVVEYNNKLYYVEENSDIKYQNKEITTIGNNFEEFANETNINNENVKNFEHTAVVTTSEYIAITPKDNIIYNTDGQIKDILTNDVTMSDNQNEFTISNNTDELVKYRITIASSTKTTLDPQYIRYQLSVKGEYKNASKLTENIWKDDGLSDVLKPTNTNYILLDDTIEPYETINIRLMLWTDYDTIPNTMQNKYFYGTIHVYAWKEN